MDYPSGWWVDSFFCAICLCIFNLVMCLFKTIGHFFNCSFPPSWDMYSKVAVEDTVRKTMTTSFKKRSNDSHHVILKNVGTYLSHCAMNIGLCDHIADLWSLWFFPCALEKKCILLLMEYFINVTYKCSIVLFCSSIASLIWCLIILYITERGLLKSIFICL